MENAPSALVHIEFLYGRLLLDLIDQSIEAFSVLDCHWAEQVVASMYAKCSTISFDQSIYLVNPFIPSTISLGNIRVEIPISIPHSSSPVQIQPAMIMANLHNANSIPSNSILNLENYWIVKFFLTIQFNLIFWIEIKDETPCYFTQIMILRVLLHTGCIKILENLYGESIWKIRLMI